MLDHFGTPERTFYADPEEYALVEDLTPAARRALLDKDTGGAERILEDCARLDLRLMTLQAAAYPERLRQLCGELGVGCDIIGRVELDGITVSSTYIRTLIQKGDMERAARFLGHPHTLSGPGVHGKGLGRTIGIPTSNLVVPQGVLMPAFGVYATRVWIEGKGYLAVTNVGVRPTVENTDRVTVEPWILDFDGDLYGQNIRVEFYKQLRPERKFGSIDELKTAILKNAQETRLYFG